MASIIQRGSPAYEEARIGRVFNHRRPKRYPRAVVEAATLDDIMKTVQLAKIEGCSISIRSGGHSWAAWSVRDDAILLDLGKYQFMELNESKTIAKVSPSITGNMLNGFLVTKGKMFAGGHCPDVAVGGFLLQGGMGWNCAHWGWACEKVKAIDVVTSEGNILHCDENENQELLWAARGAGPGFPAIVTAFYLELRDSFKAVKSSTFVWPISEYAKVMDWTIKVSQESDDSIEGVAVAMFPPGSTEMAITSHFVTFQQTEEAAIASLSHIDNSRPPGAIKPIIEVPCVPTSLRKEYEDQAAANPHKHRYRCDNAYIENNANVTEVLREAFTTLPHGTKAFTLWFSMAPASRREMPDMALSMQSDHYFAIYCVWEDEKDDERCNAWVSTVMAKVERHSVGAYLGDSDFQVRRTRFWGEKQGKRLMELRRKWDPEGRICGYLDEGDRSGTAGLENIHEWQRKL
ncbi:hypothetical protein G7Y89_g13076 [Cudoniella acicularis]|uniref:FAD-binding PCMH-type domain-containing protein n=1 Tax=Cudoniella acicularis TaxID=354080 RepID=A0A8H4RA80_9HELO|nr:hypothetical protein G7Y89_g13076 [Cudoniella acicularis]